MIEAKSRLFGYVPSHIQRALVLQTDIDWHNLQGVTLVEYLEGWL